MSASDLIMKNKLQRISFTLNTKDSSSETTKKKICAFQKTTSTDYFGNQKTYNWFNVKIPDIATTGAKPVDAQYDRTFKLPSIVPVKGKYSVSTVPIMYPVGPHIMPNPTDGKTKKQEFKYQKKIPSNGVLHFRVDLY
jgi:hypothetical protein